MAAAAFPQNEAQRIAELLEFDVLDSLPEAEYDDITKIAADICQMPISLISLIDSNRQWFKSRVGLEAAETGRDIAFCAHAILDPNNMFIVPDAKADERFKSNPLVTGDLNIGFYGGVPLVTRKGHALGTLCVIDQKPNKLSGEQRETLRRLARQVVAHLELRRVNRELAQRNKDLSNMNQELEHFAMVVAHDIKSPCSSISMGVDYLKEMYGSAAAESDDNILELIQVASGNIRNMVDEILSHAKVIHSADLARDTFRFGDLVEDLRNILHVEKTVVFEVDGLEKVLMAPRSTLMQILLNLCSNAIKYNDKELPSIKIIAGETPTAYTFVVADNGIGIEPESQTKVFDLFTTLGKETANGASSHGIGLATVKRLIEKMDGAISLTSMPGQGSTFSFYIRK